MICRALLNIFFHWKEELQSLPDTSDLLKMLTNVVDVSITCSADVNSLEMPKIAHLIHLSADTFNVFVSAIFYKLFPQSSIMCVLCSLFQCQKKHLLLPTLSPSIEAGVQTLSPRRYDN